jgi:hypothetical protein
LSNFARTGLGDMPNSEEWRHAVIISELNECLTTFVIKTEMLTIEQ